MQSNNLRLKISRRHLFYGLLLFAATWSVVPIVVICITYHIPSSHLWMTLLIESIYYFLPGLLLGLSFFGSFRLWSIWQGSQIRWFVPSVVFGFALFLLEVIIVRASLIALVSHMLGLIIAGMFTSMYWLAINYQKIS